MAGGQVARVGQNSRPPAARKTKIGRKKHDGSPGCIKLARTFSVISWIRHRARARLPGLDVQSPWLSDWCRLCDRHGKELNFSASPHHQRVL